MDNSYLRKLCSDVTLQSQKEGFFNQWVDQVENLLPNKFFIQFSQLKTDKERFSLTWKQECVHTLQIQECFTPKNLEVSEEKRIQGNKAFQANDNNKAIVFYTQGIIRAPTKGEGLSLCFANRSAALFHCKEYKLCLQDISLALSHGYPNRLKYKILERQGQCLAKFGKIKESELSFQEAILAVQESDLKEERKEIWIQETLKKIIKNQESLETFQDENSEDDVYEEKLYKNKSKIFPRASSSLTLKYSKETGRYMTASEDIPAVKVLVRELPFSSVLMQEKRGSFCENCFKKIMAPIPCSECSGVTFCSSECQTKGLNSYHKWECHYLNLFKASGMSLNCFLALRVVTERGLEFFKTNCSEDLKITEPPSKNSPHNPDDFKTFYNLVGLEEQRDPMDFFRRSLMAVFLLKVLQDSGFFEKKFSEKNIDEDDELFIGSILLRNLQVIQFNAHEVSGISFEGKRCFSKCKSIYLGLAVYPTVSFFNHSCYPAVGRYFNGKEMTIVNLRPLNKGEMVAENYGPIFTHSNRDQRQKKLLSRYWFTCKCEACEDDWPMYNNMPNKISFVEPAEIKEETKNKNKKKKNKNMKQNDDVTDENSKETKKDFNDVGKVEFLTNIQKHFDIGKSLMDEFKREEAIQEYLKYVEALIHKVKLPVKDLHLSLESLRLLVGARGTSYITQK